MAHIQLIGMSEAASPDGKIWKFPYALPVLVRGLVDTKHTFDLLDTHLHKIPFESLAKFAHQCNSKVYGISAWSHNYLLVKEVITIIRSSKPDAVIIVGGILSGNYRAILENTDADIVSVSAEGEKALPEILDALDGGTGLENILGIAYRDRFRDEIVITPQRPLTSKEEFKSWSGQPIPVYEYFDTELKEMVENINSRTDVPVNGFPILTMRGCPFQCTFCGFFTGTKFLRMSWEGFFNELEFLIDRYGVRGIYSYDTNMFLNKKSLDEFCDEYVNRQHDFLSAVELRPTFGDVEMFRQMKQHGIRVILFGIEHGSQEMLDRMKKGYKVKVTERIYQDAVKAGLFIHGNILFGTPGETANTIKQTRPLMKMLDNIIDGQNRQLARKNEVGHSGYGWSVLIPAPPSELYEIAINDGLIKDEGKYLASLSDKENFKLIKGSNYAIALKQRGGDVNMSEFSSSRSLKSYIVYNKLVVELARNETSHSFVHSIVKKGFLLIKACLLYIRYLCDESIGRVGLHQFQKDVFTHIPFGVTQGSSWPKLHQARYDWPTAWSDAYKKENAGRKSVVIPTGAN